jgi:hypothetical protein
MSREKNERWRPVIGWEGLYEVSQFGRVRSISRWVTSFGGKKLVEGRILARNVASTGYPQVMLCDSGRSRFVSVHRLVAESFVLGDGPVVRHLDGNRENNHADNLAWGSYADNERDKDLHGRRPRGENHHYSKMTNGDIREIRSMHKRGVSQVQIAKHIGISRGSVYNVISGKNWSHVN